MVVEGMKKRGGGPSFDSWRRKDNATVLSEPCRIVG